MIKDAWYKDAVVCSLAVEAFMDSDGDGCGRISAPKDSDAETS